MIQVRSGTGSPGTIRGVGGWGAGGGGGVALRFRPNTKSVGPLIVWHRAYSATMAAEGGGGGGGGAGGSSALVSIGGVAIYNCPIIEY